MHQPQTGNITIDEVHETYLQGKQVKLDLLRLDKIHPVISGNKWFKLKYHLQNFAAGNYKGILTFGGAWSNHIVATACACYLQKISCVGIIRGEKPVQLSTTLAEAIKYGMRLKFLPRTDYDQKKTDNFFEALNNEFPGFYVVPEGGAGADGERGAGEILQLVSRNNYTHIACAVGTGTMFRGIKKSASLNQRVMGVVVLKGWIEETEMDNGKLFYDYHFGGYAKVNAKLIEFMNEFYRHTNIPTDFVYTAKLAFAITDLIRQEYFPSGSKILMVHSGGLQGNSSLQKGSLIF